MSSLRDIWLVSLIPSLGLLGVFYAYWRQKRPPTSSRTAFGLVVVVGSALVALSLSGRKWMPEDLRELIRLIAVYLFAFALPRCFHRWVCFRPPVTIITLAAVAGTLVEILLVVLGCLWALLMVGMCFSLIVKAFPFFQ